ncbi:MAG: dihydropyrimidinase [Clostridia bacterium]|nr:dihydropyrimidinase [Clostridia bacterium]
MIIIKGGHIVTPLAVYASDIAVEGSKIKSVEPNIDHSPGDRVIDASGALVFPGFIDAHTHFDMNNGVMTTADDFASGTKAAIIGGTTTIIDYATQNNGETLTQALRAWHQKADGVCSCDYGFHMAITDWNYAIATQLLNMVSSGVTSFKLYMAYDALRLDDEDIIDVMSHMKLLKTLACVHCENGDLVNYLVSQQKLKGNLSPSAHPASRPAQVEAEALSRLLYISDIIDWPVNIVHLSSALGLGEVRKARARGQKVFVETCPQYMLLDEGLYSLEGFESAKYVCSPPLRSKYDVGEIAGAAVAGEIDTIATDHCSYNYKWQKMTGVNDFSDIPNGLPGVEFRPGLIYGQFVKAGLMKAETMCALLSERPAKLYGLYPRKGALLEGSDADIVIWKNADIKANCANQHMKCDYSPFEGMDMGGRAETVLLRGEVIVENGEVANAGRGIYLKRDLPMIDQM